MTKKTKLAPVVIGLLLGILIASLDNTITSTAMGTIIADLGGFDKFVWVTSAYLVAEMAGMPIFGKLSDMYGRKRFFVFGIILFLFGSILCGMAQNIIQLSIFRAIQGIGGSALMPIAFTIVWDVFPMKLRAKMGGIFGAVFGLSSIFGPLLGGLITEHINWRWIFYINLPLGVIALVLIISFYKETAHHEKQRIDWWGALTLVGSIVSLMFALELGGNNYAWTSTQIIGLFAGFIVLLAIFLFVETRASDPIISFNMFKKRLFITSNMIGVFYGGAFIAATIYIPIFIQGVLGGSAINSGLVLLPMMLGTTVTAPLGGLLATKTSYRNIMAGSTLVLFLGIFLLSLLTKDSTRLMVTIDMVIVGLGTGASFSVLSMSAIHHFGSRQRGAASSTNAFLRSLGMTVGITIFGVIQRNFFTAKLKEVFKGFGSMKQMANLSDPHAMLSPETRTQIPPAILHKISAAMASSIAHTFFWAMIPVAVALIFVLLMGKERMQPESIQPVSDQSMIDQELGAIE